MPVAAACGDDGEPTGAAAGRTPSGSADQAEGDDEGPTVATLDLRPATPMTTTPDDRALSALLPQEPPLEGFERADDILGAGPLDLDAAAAAEADVATERSRLEARGFQRGASRAWIDPDQDVVYLAVYDFDGAGGATAYLDDSGQSLESRGATRFDVPEVAGARGYTTVEEGEQGTFTAHAVAFTSGERWVLVLVGSPSSARTEDDARAVAAAQAALLG